MVGGVIIPVQPRMRTTKNEPHHFRYCLLRINGRRVDGQLSVIVRRYRSFKG